VLQDQVADFARDLLLDPAAAETEVLPVAGLQHAVVAGLETWIARGLAEPVILLTIESLTDVALPPLT
jgi:hypothetical protein